MHIRKLAGTGLLLCLFAPLPLAARLAAKEVPAVRWGTDRSAEGSRVNKKNSSLTAKQKRRNFFAKMCDLVEKEARKAGLQPAFLARLIWVESRFNPGAVSHKGAQGIAQFIPATAKRRALKDPFEPVGSIRAAARFLQDLRAEFGNVGLAAAAYNAGEARVRSWRAGRAALPFETINYVQMITGVSAQSWNRPQVKEPVFRLHKTLNYALACRKLAERPLLVSRAGRAMAPRKPWGVLLTSSRSYGGALRFYSRLQKRHSALLGNKRPMVLRKRNGSFGRARRHSVIIGTDNRAGARILCSKLTAQGGYCLVVKN